MVDGVGGHCDIVREKMVISEEEVAILGGGRCKQLGEALLNRCGSIVVSEVLTLKRKLGPFTAHEYRRCILLQNCRKRIQSVHSSRYIKCGRTETEMLVSQDGSVVLMYALRTADIRRGHETA